MQYQKLKNQLDNVTIQQSKFRTKIWVEISKDREGV